MGPMIAYVVPSNGVVLQGALGGANEVKALQQALVNLAAKRANPSMDPGGVDGIVGQRTLTALLSALQLVPIPKVSSTTKNLVLAALGFGLIPGTATYDAAKRVVEQYAGVLAPAIAAATAVVGSTAPIPGAGGMGPGGFPIGAIGRFHKTKKVWRIYAPIGGGMAGLGCTNPSAPGGGPVTGPCGYRLNGASLGAFGATAASDSEPPPGTLLVGESPILPQGVTNAGTEDTPWYKKWQFWVPIGIGAVAVGAGVKYARK